MKEERERGGDAVIINKIFFFTYYLLHIILLYKKRDKMLYKQKVREEGGKERGMWIKLTMDEKRIYKESLLVGWE